MEHLKREDFDAVIQSGNKLLLYCYQKEDPESILGLNTITEIDRMIGKDFQMFLIEISEQPEISQALGIGNVPEFICIENKKIHKRVSGLQYSNQVLDIVK